LNKLKFLEKLEIGKVWLGNLPVELFKYDETCISFRENLLKLYNAQKYRQKPKE
jgi:hypothetical protein